MAKRTLEDWYYGFKKGGFDRLKPKLRSDRGKPRRLSPEQQRWILERVRSFPGVPVKLLYRQWKQTDPTLPALSAVYRWLEQNDLDAQGRRYLLRQNIPGPTKAFEAPGVNDLWIVDFSPGPFLTLQPKTVGRILKPAYVCPVKGPDPWRNSTASSPAGCRKSATAGIMMASAKALRIALPGPYRCYAR